MELLIIVANQNIVIFIKTIKLIKNMNKKNIFIGIFSLFLIMSFVIAAESEWPSFESNERDIITVGITDKGQWNIEGLNSDLIEMDTGFEVYRSDFSMHNNRFLPIAKESDILFNLRALVDDKSQIQLLLSVKLNDAGSMRIESISIPSTYKVGIPTPYGLNGKYKGEFVSDTVLKELLSEAITFVSKEGEARESYTDSDPSGWAQFEKELEAINANPNNNVMEADAPSGWATWSWLPWNWGSEENSETSNYVSKCSDNEDGINFFKKGTVKGYSEGDLTDYCDVEGVRLREWFCYDSSTFANIWITCPKGCVDGACIPITDSNGWIEFVN